MTQPGRTIAACVRQWARWESNPHAARAAADFKSAASAVPPPRREPGPGVRPGLPAQPIAAVPGRLALAPRHDTTAGVRRAMDVATPRYLRRNPEEYASSEHEGGRGVPQAALRVRSASHPGSRATGSRNWRHIVQLFCRGSTGSPRSIVAVQGARDCPPELEVPGHQAKYMASGRPSTSCTGTSMPKTALMVSGVTISRGAPSATIRPSFIATIRSAWQAAKLMS